MKMKYLGTAAAEGYPAPFCGCERCKTALELGGRNLRTRAQGLINDELLLDLPCDTYSHFLQYRIDTTKIKAVLITHIHADHLYAQEIGFMHPGATVPHKDFQLTVYGSEDVAPEVKRFVENSNGFLKFEELKPFVPVEIEGYTVTALKAYHGTPHPYIYMISQDGKNLLYAHDTDLFPEETAEYLEKTGAKFDFVSLDCTCGNMPDNDWRGHLYLNTDIICKNYMLEKGMADENTVFVLNHFSHNGPDSNYDDMVKLAEPHGFVVAYDGVEFEI